MLTQNLISFGANDWAVDPGHGSGVTRSGLGKFPNPFCDIASEYVPHDINTLFAWCEYLMLAVAPFRTVSQRVVRYFLTELVLEGQSDVERKRFEEFLNDQLHLLQQLAEIGDDYMTYGNVFISLYFPFDRYLTCPKCRTEYHVETIKYKFDNNTGEFRCDCGKCGSKDIVMERDDRVSRETARTRVIRWSPKEIKLRVHPISRRIEYYLQLDSKLVSKIREGSPFYLNDTPWKIVEACVKGSKDSAYLFRFDEDAIYHLRSGSLSGLPIKGWAIPPILPNFKLAYYVQLLRRYDEAIALDFIIPFRIIYPEAGPGSNDPLALMSMSSFVAQMTRMIESKRKNPTDIAISPVPIGYEALGGEARTLAPKDNVALAVDELLNSLGFPAELYKGTLSIQAFPVALRLFEKQWNSLVDGFNDLADWICSRVSQYFMWDEVQCTLRSVTLADDIERKALSLQAAAGGDISKATAYRPLGIDYAEEQRRVIEEQELIQRLQQQAMERAQAQQGMPQEGADGSGGAPAAGGTPGDVHEQAQALAHQLLTQTPETMRRGELIKIKHSNPTLHALVLQAMNEMRQQMAREGQAMIMEQAKQASVQLGPTKALPSPIRIGLLISDQVFDYNTTDLEKIAMDIKNNVKGAKEAFTFIYTQLTGKVL